MVKRKFLLLHKSYSEGVEMRKLSENEIKQISEKIKISELYVAKKLIELAKKHINEENRKKTHIGYYLISNGKEELLNTLGIKCEKQVSNRSKAKKYIFLNYFIATMLSLLFGGLTPT